MFSHKDDLGKPIQYLFIKNFDKHQVVNKPSAPLLHGWEKSHNPKTYAEKMGCDYQELGDNDLTPIPETSHTTIAPLLTGKERKGKEGKGKEGKGRERITSQAAIASDDIKEAFNYYNLIAEKYGLTKAIKLSDDRKRLLGARLNEYGLDTWKEAMDKVGSCPHLMGDNDRNWKADLSFFLKKSKFLKHMEGSYEQSNNNTADRERDRRRKAIVAGLVS